MCICGDDGIGAFCTAEEVPDACDCYSESCAPEELTLLVFYSLNEGAHSRQESVAVVGNHA